MLLCTILNISTTYLRDMKSLALNRILRLAFALSIAALVNEINLDYIESYIYDLRVRLSPAPQVSGHVSTVSISPSTVQFFQGVPSMGHHVQALKQLLKANPRSVTYLTKPDQIFGTPKEIAEFAKLAKKIPFYVLANHLSMKGEDNKFSMPKPLNKLTVFSGPKTADTTLFAKDGVTRRALYSYQNQPLLQVHLAQSYNTHIKDPGKVRGLWSFRDSNQVYIHYAPKGSFIQIKFEDLVKGEFDPKNINDKIILIGTDLGTTIKNYASSPYSRAIEHGLPTLELNANMIDTFIRNSAPIQSPKWLNILLTFITSLITVYVVLSIHPLNGLLIIVGILGVFFLTAYLSYWPFGIWLKISHPIATIFMCYYFFIPYRLIKENRRSWEYYQKNKLLTKVEELKDNFISMMSHDLKTPLARIQGMADVIRTDQTVSLSEQQNQAVETIQSSSLELTDFIESILNFSRIESHGVELQFKSQDVNQLIKESIRKLDFKAKSKNIELISELEPLFSLKMDPYLIRQILTNLIENSIKYSPEGTKILINSDEQDDFIVVQISDQGQGISKNDLENIFMKFYRCKEAKTSAIKGSGLGLYLSQYFAHLHKGKITVESDLNMGSTFNLYIPYNKN